MALSLTVAPAGLMIGAAPMARTNGIVMADIMTTLETMDGPEIFWGSAGVEIGYEESDIKGSDGFGKFAAALKAEGVDVSGELTVLAPADSAFDKAAEDGVTVTADILKYHLIPGKVTMDGLKSEGPSKSSNWPSDVEADNGIIHAIDTIL